MSTENIVIVNGDPMNGFTIVGPFIDYDSAIEYADLKLKHEPWWTAKINNPDPKFGLEVEF